jgi:hypothetical protein
MKEVKAWKCDFCPRCFTRKANAERHLSRCRMNPEMRNCKTCVYGCKDVVSMKPCPWDRDEPMDEYGACCSYHGKPISEKPYYIDCETIDVGGWAADVTAGLRGSGIDCTNPYPRDYERPVPGTCEHYKYKGYAGWGEPVYPEGETS